MNSLRFLVTFHSDERTVWRDGEEAIGIGLEVLAKTFVRSYSTGSIPAVTVELLPAQPPTVATPVKP